MESYLLVLASLILLIPIIMYLPLGITSKGKMIIVFGAIIVASIGVYANMTFPLWQTAGMLLLIIIAMTFFMGEKFDGLIFDQEGNDLTAFKSEGPVVEVEEKDDLIHFISNQKQTNEELPNQGMHRAQPEEIKAEMVYEAVTEDKNRPVIADFDLLETNQMIEIEDEQPTELDVSLDETAITWDKELLQEDPPLISENEPDVMDAVNAEPQTSDSEPSPLIDSEDELPVISNKAEQFGSLTNDEVAFLLERDELISSDELSVHYMEDIEILLEDEDENLKAATNLIEDEPSVDPIVNVFDEGDLSLLIDELEKENTFNEKASEDIADEHELSDLVELEKVLSKNTDENKFEPVVEIPDLVIDDDVAVANYFNSQEDIQANELAEDIRLDDDKVILNDKPITQEDQEPIKTTAEQSMLQTQLFDTFFYQIKLAKMSCSDKEYELLIKGYLTDELPDQTYYQFSTLLLDHYIEKQNWEELKHTLFELQNRFEQYPILAEQLDYLYQTYCG